MNDLTIICDDEGSSDNIHRIEGSAAIEPGHYWRCTKDVAGMLVNREDSGFEFDKGRMYLLTSLEYFDGKLHSVVLLDDPACGNSSGVLTLELFLGAFEPMNEAAATEFRNNQIAQIQGQAAEVQKEMTDAQSDPALLKGVIEKGLQEWERELARNRGDDDDESSAQSKSNLPAISTNGRFDLTAAIGHKIGVSDVAVFRHMAQREGKIAEIRGKWLQNKVQELGRVLGQLTPFFAEHAALGLARAKDALDLAKDVEKGLRSLRLYTGEGVSVSKLIEGDSAPASEPLTLYQRKLFMNEEFAVWDDVDRMFDYTQNEVFFKALAENESLRQQLIPAPRGVVAMATRRDNVKYDAKTIQDVLENVSKNEMNKALFLLVRDGGNWYQVWSDEPSHEISQRLFPTRNEMDGVFEGFDGEKIGFEDLRFTKRANEFDRKSLSYKRFLILACGLDHRLKLFGEFYPEAEALKFISMDFQRKYMRFVADDDSDVMLGDTVGDVHSFIRNNLDQVVAGCRVLVFGQNALEQEAAPSAFDRGRYNSRSYTTDYEQLVKPKDKMNLLTVHRDKGDLVVYLPVKRVSSHTYSPWGTRRELKRPEFNARVALNKLSNNDLAYLVVDAVSADELKPFIYNRRSRAAQVNYIYGFKLAVQALEKTERANALSIAALSERAAVHYGLEKSLVPLAVRSAIQTWREKTPDAGELYAAGVEGMSAADKELAEVAYAFKHAIPAVEAYIEKLGGKVIRVMRGKKGMLIAYYEQPESERDARIQSWDWVGRRTFTAAGKPTKDGPETVWLREGGIAGECQLTVKSSSLIHKGPPRTDLAKLKTFLDKATEMAEILSGAFKGERQGVSDRAWLALTAEKAKPMQTDPVQRNREVLLPLGISTRRTEVLGVSVRVFDLLYWYGSDAQRAVLTGRGYRLPTPEKKKPVVPPMLSEGALSLISDTYAHPENYIGVLGAGVSGNNHYFNRDYKGERRLDQALTQMMTKTKKVRDAFNRTVDLSEMWFPEQFRNAAGEFTVSRFFPGLPSA